MRSIPKLLFFLVLITGFQAQAETTQFTKTDKVFAKTDKVKGVAGRVAQLEAQVASLEAALAQMQEILQFVRVEPGPINNLAGPHIVFEGANVHVRSGAGSTDEGCGFQPPDGPDLQCDNLTGRGNFIVGYNEEAIEGWGSAGDRNGSHNLILGSVHTYTSFGGLVVGIDNSIHGRLAAVTGGLSNTATGFGSSISGGELHEARAEAAWIGGGVRNIASGVFSGVSGGLDNVASGQLSWIGGGSLNKALGGSDSVSGGVNNVAHSNNEPIGAAWVGGGNNNTATGDQAVVCGGSDNTASGIRSTVAGGRDNEAVGASSVVSGGQNRTAPNDYNWVAGSLLEPN